MTPARERITTLLSQMTLDEKLAQVGSCWVHELQADKKLDVRKMETRLANGIGQITRVAGASTMDPQSAARAGNQIQKFLVEKTRLGIPAILHEESCAGAMILGGSAFPQPIGLASTFQPELAEKMTGVIRRQLLAIGARQSLAPVLDVSRDPRWGRTEETFGEDPTLVSHFGMAYVRGLQGETLAEGIMATGKHFIAHSLSQGGMNCGPVHLGMQELREVLLGPFQAAIRDANLASIMNSYPELDGEVVAASRRILTTLLRDELGFDGLVVSDYDAVMMLHTFHRAAADQSAAGRMALHAGIDVELPTTICYGEPLKQALESGQISMDTLDTAVSRHLQKKIELGLFEHPYVDESRVLEVFETPDQRSLAREIATRSMVLLKNDGLLPLKKDLHSLAVIGPNAANPRSLLGDYSYEAVVELMSLLPYPDSSFYECDAQALTRQGINVVSVLDGIKGVVSPQTQILYARGCDNLEEGTQGFEEALGVAQAAEAIVLVLGDRAGLVPSCTTGETRDSADLRLPGEQEKLARAILQTSKPVVVVLVTGRPYAIPWLDEHANAILEAWLPGEQGGTAVAELLFGDANPGGKLPLTFPRQAGQVPIFYNHKPSGMRSHWYGDYVAEKAAPLYPFGYGLSYTTFAYDSLSMSSQTAQAGDSVQISLRVTNTGSRSGDEVVQLYTCDEIGSVPRPVKELKGYLRLRLEAGDSRTVTFDLPVNQLAFYDNDLNLVLEPGTIQVMLGASSDDIRLSGRFEILGTGKIPVSQRVFTCPASSS